MNPHLAPPSMTSVDASVDASTFLHTPDDDNLQSQFHALNVQQNNSQAERSQLTSTQEANIKNELPDLGNYHISYNDLIMSRKIGQGQFGVVYQGSYRNIPVAVKKLKSADEKDIEDFKREILVLKDVPNHPNIVMFMGATLDPGHFTIVTEYISNGDLAQNISKPTWSTDAADVLYFSRQIAAGLHLLHSLRKPIIHRDLKPSNILMNKNRQLKLCDFGVSRFYTKASKMTVEIGSPAYMAPETFGENNYTTKVDIYSLGVVIWQMCLRQDPWTDKSGNTMSVQQIISKLLIRKEPLTVPSSIYQPLRLLISKCLSLNPNDRPTADQIIKYIDKELEKLHISNPNVVVATDDVVKDDQFRNPLAVMAMLPSKDSSSSVINPLDTIHNAHSSSMGTSNNDNQPSTPPTKIPQFSGRPDWKQLASLREKSSPKGFHRDPSPQITREMIDIVTKSPKSSPRHPSTGSPKHLSPRQNMMRPGGSPINPTTPSTSTSSSSSSNSYNVHQQHVSNPIHSKTNRSISHPNLNPPQSLSQSSHRKHGSAIMPSDSSNIQKVTRPWDLIGDSEGQIFWYNNFRDQHTVQLATFLRCFVTTQLESLNPSVKETLKQFQESDIFFLKWLLVSDREPPELSTQEVTPYSFHIFLTLLGPFNHSLVNAINIIRSGWFHCYVTFDQVAPILENKPIGSFFVRLSHGCPGSFVVAFHHFDTQTQSCVVNQTRVDPALIKESMHAYLNRYPQLLSIPVPYEYKKNP